MKLRNGAENIYGGPKSAVQRIAAQIIAAQSHSESIAKSRKCLNFVLHSPMVFGISIDNSKVIFYQMPISASTVQPRS